MPASIVANLAELADAFEIRSVPESWSRHWQAFVDIEKSNERLEWRIPATASMLFDLPDDVLPVIRQSMDRIKADPMLDVLARFWFFLVYQLHDEIGDNSNGWLIPTELHGVPVRLLSLVVLAAGADRAAKNLADCGMGDSICRASMAFIGQRVCDVRSKRGVWGVESFSFMRYYVRAQLFRLGRLTFRLSPYHFAFRMFRNDGLGETITLCDAPVRCGRDGLAVGADSLDAEGWTSPALAILESEIVGTRVDQMGRIERAPVRLRREAWREMLRPGDLRIEVHVAPGEKLDPAACATSYREAMRMFPRRSVGPPVAGFTCISWLLDPTFRELLPETSNIVRFAEPYRLLAIPGDHRQAYDLIFSTPDADPVQYVATHPATTLQKAIARHVGQGGTIRSVAGFIPWDDAMLRFY